jgi:hypothetical protein|tara:strand:- start:2612 stop:3655 length:1044 start_codon:yes stop_codon:yes gene_type:complete
VIDMARAYPPKYGEYTKWSDARWRAAWDRIWAKKGMAKARQRNAALRNNPFQQAVNAGMHPALLPQMNPQVQAALINAQGNRDVARLNAMGRGAFQAPQQQRQPFGYNWFQNPWAVMADVNAGIYGALDRQARLQDQNASRIWQTKVLNAQAEMELKKMQMFKDIFGQKLGAGVEMSKNFSDALAKGLPGLNWVNLAGGQGVRHKGDTAILSQDVPRVEVAKRSNARRRGGTTGSLGVPGGSAAGRAELEAAGSSARGSGGSAYAAATGDAFDDSATGLKTGRAATVAKDILQQLGTSTKAKGDKTRNQIAGLRADATIEGAQRRAQLDRIGANMNMLTNMMGNLWG